MTIADSDNRWVWNLDPRKTFAQLSAYKGNRQVTGLPLAQFTDPGVLPTNDGTNQIFDRVPNPFDDSEMVWLHQIRSNRASNASWSPNTFRSELSNTNAEPKWGIEYWCAWAVLFGADFMGSGPTCTIHEYHVPWPAPTPVLVSCLGMMAGGGNFSLAIRAKEGMPANSNDRPLVHSWSAPATVGIWHYFVENFRLGADNPSNFFRLWHKIGGGALAKVVDYTGRIGYNKDTPLASRYEYAKHGLYSWTYPWPSGSSSRTMWTKGTRLIAAAGTPAIDENVMLGLIYAGAVVDPEPEPPALWQGVTFADVTRFQPIKDGADDTFLRFAASSITGVQMTQAPLSVVASGTAQFAATVSGNGDFDDTIVWSVESGGGSIDTNGLYTAGSAGSATIRATSDQDGAQYDESVITIVSVAAPNAPAISQVLSFVGYADISGTGINGATIDLRIDTETIAGVATVAGGAWAYRYFGNAGPYTVEARQTTGDGTSDWSTETEFAIAADVPGGTVTLSTTWKFDGVVFANQPLDYIVKNGANETIASGTQTTTGSGVLIVNVPEAYTGQKLVVHVENIGPDGVTTGKVHGTQVATAA